MMMANPVSPDLQSYQKRESEPIKAMQVSCPRPLVPLVPVFEDVVITKEPVRLDKEELLKEKPEPKTPAPEAEPRTDTEPQTTDSLEDLIPVDRLLVTRKLRLREAITLKGKKNDFRVVTPDNNLVYTIEEDNGPSVFRSWFVGYFCYSLRPMQLHVKNNQGVEVMRICRPYSFTMRIMPCYLQRLLVFSPPDQLIGTVHQRWTPVRPIYMVHDVTGAPTFEVHGPRITISCFQDVSFQVRRPDGTLVASTTKRWEGLIHALFYAPVTDEFGMVFLEKALTGEEKALLLAAALLLDYMYYDV